MPPKVPNSELIDYQFKTMNEKLEQHQDYTKGEFLSLHTKMDKFIEKADKTFATKQDHESNSKRIEELEQNKWWIIRLVL